jgi:uncharacterized repeat protein (TIGR02543 family)
MASLDSDYLFNGWTVVGGYTPYGFNAAANPLAFAMPNRDVEIAPNLTLNTFTLTATATTGGSVNPTSQSIVPGTEFSVTATPTAGYVFTGWTVVSGAAPTGFVATENPLTATMGSENLAVQANFALIPLYKITSVTAAAGITVTNGANAANARAGGVPAGTVVTLTASAAVGYTLIGFTVSGATDTDAAIGTVTFTMPSADVTVSTTSQLSARTVTATATTGGSVNPTSQSIVPGATFSIQATPSSGNQFYGWTVTGGTTPEGFVATENPLSATMGSENLSVQATFGPPLYKITASGMNLVFTYDANAEKARTTGVVAGTPITVTARPMNAFFTITSFAPFGGVTDTNSAIDVVSFVMPAQNVNIIGNASL